MTESERRITQPAPTVFTASAPIAPTTATGNEAERVSLAPTPFEDAVRALLRTPKKD